MIEREKTKHNARPCFISPGEKAPRRCTSKRPNAMRFLDKVAFSFVFAMLLLHVRASLYSLGVTLEAAPLMPIQLVAFPAPASGVLIFPNPRSRSRMIFSALRLRR